MIERLIRVQGIGLLHDALPNGALELGRVVAVYAENGRGKTTWSTICHSLAVNNGQLLAERATIGGSLSPAVELLLDDACYRFQSGAWDARCSNLIVFDSGFVDRNVYSGVQIGPEHRENLLEFALGEQGVSLKAQVDNIADEIQTMNRDMQAKEKIIKAYAGPYSVDDFMALRQDPGLDKTIEQLEAKIRMAENSQAMSSRPTLKEVALPAVAVEPIKSLLGETLESVSDSAEKAVREHIEQHLADGGEAWIGQGIGIMKLGACPFCGQDIEGIQLIKAYREYFGEAYKDLKERITKAKAEVERVLSEQALGEVLLVLQHNSSTRTAWADRTDVTFPEGPSDDSISVAWRALRDAMSADLTGKAEQPLKQLVLSASTDGALRAYDDLVGQSRVHAESVKVTNAVLLGLKKEAGSANVAQLREDLSKLRAARKRLDPPVHQECAELRQLRTQKRLMEGEKADKRRQLDRFTDSLMSSLMTAVNAKLSLLGAEQLSIVEMKASYAGGKPRSDYRLRLRGTNIPLAPAKGAVSNQCFSNTLSDGDRRTLALAFFLAGLETDPGLANRTVVVDDPVSSFDVSRRRATLEDLAALAGRVSQLVVMSHNADFVRDFAAKATADAGACQVLQIRRSGSGSIFDTCNIHDVCESEYYANYRTLRSCLTDGCSGNPRPIAKAIRPYLERALRERLPLEFAGDERLGHMISRIRGSKPDSPLRALIAQLSDIERLNDYASRFHHDANLNADGETTTDNELKPMVELALRIGTGLA
jgi:wobble nucleotide-excising tRNase